MFWSQNSHWAFFFWNLKTSKIAGKSKNCSLFSLFIVTKFCVTRNIHNYHEFFTIFYTICHSFITILCNKGYQTNGNNLRICIVGHLWWIDISGYLLLDLLLDMYLWICIVGYVSLVIYNWIPIIQFTSFGSYLSVHIIGLLVSFRSYHWVYINEFI